MDLQNLNKIGEKSITYLYKAGIYNIESLLTYYPYRYEIEKPAQLPYANKDETININATVIQTSKATYLKRNLNILRIKAEANGLVFTIIIYNRAFLKPNLKPGKQIIVTGKFDPHKRVLVASNIRFGILTKTEIIPIYHSIKNVKPYMLTNWLNEALNEDVVLDDYIPKEYIEKYNFPSKKEAIKILHKPMNEQEIYSAKNRLIYEELFLFLFKVQYLKQQKNDNEAIIKDINMDKIEAFINNLPFTLTNDQKKGIDAGIKDFTTKKTMNRLLLGDVGSGKTIVAIALMYANFLAGYQSAFMAPTEILANQHYNTIIKILENYNIKIELLIGSMSKKEKNKVITKVANNEVDILIGTHAILNENLKFPKLGFVITDEQHRFGVNQRNILQQKAIKPDVLFMSATPIPRTYALMIYGDMDKTFIKEKPQGRKEVITKVKKESELKEVLYHVLEEIKQNHQIYVVAPMILENEEMPLKTVGILKEKFSEAFQHKVPIEILHGKLKNAEKDEIMNNFKEGKTKILISTTVIEVGVDVPSASTIIIFNAERFGLATLHQLRGRVGRSNIQSYCYLICNQDIKRLQVLEESTDGFYISEKDFEFRGEGDLFGEKQSGDMTFQLADLRKDQDILKRALEDVKTWITTKEYQKVTSYQKIIDEMKFNN